MIYRGKVTGLHGQDSSRFCRVVIPQVSGANSQTAQVPPGARVPAVGSDVWVVYEGGDLSKPVVISFPPPDPITGTEILDRLLDVDGTGSGLDADTLDGNGAESFSPAAHTHDYADPAHTHDYSASSHTHNYAAPSHTHDYSASSHTHDYAASSHTHAWVGSEQYRNDAASNQVITENEWTTLTPEGGGEAIDVPAGSMTSGVYTAPSTGMYTISGAVTYASGSASAFLRLLFSDGVSAAVGLPTLYVHFGTISFVRYMTTGMTVELQTTHSHTTTQGVNLYRFAVARI